MRTLLFIASAALLAGACVAPGAAASPMPVPTVALADADDLPVARTALVNDRRQSPENYVPRQCKPFLMESRRISGLFFEVSNRLIGVNRKIRELAGEPEGGDPKRLEVLKENRLIIRGNYRRLLRASIKVVDKFERCMRRAGIKL